MKGWKQYLVLSIGIFLPAFGQENVPRNDRHKIVETTVCKILDSPSSYNNKLVKIRGIVSVSSEYSTLDDTKCGDGLGIWFAFADGSGPPGLEMIVNGIGIPGGKNSEGGRTRPIPVHLIRDAGYLDLVRYLQLSAKGATCLDQPASPDVPDCTTYRVAATFTGRIDSVSKATHIAHLRKSFQAPPDFKGFGHMGLFDAQMVVQLVENVEVTPRRLGIHLLRSLSFFGCSLARQLKDSAARTSSTRAKSFSNSATASITD